MRNLSTRQGTARRSAIVPGIGPHVTVLTLGPIRFIAIHVLEKKHRYFRRYTIPCPCGPMFGRFSAVPTLRSWARRQKMKREEARTRGHVGRTLCSRLGFSTERVAEALKPAAVADPTPSWTRTFWTTKARASDGFGGAACMLSLRTLCMLD